MEYRRWGRLLSSSLICLDLQGFFCFIGNTSKSLEKMKRRWSLDHTAPAQGGANSHIMSVTAPQRGTGSGSSGRRGGGSGVAGDRETALLSTSSKGRSSRSPRYGIIHWIADSPIHTEAHSNTDKTAK